jgi:hypothetical protein
VGKKQDWPDSMNFYIVPGQPREYMFNFEGTLIVFGKP